MGVDFDAWGESPPLIEQSRSWRAVDLSSILAGDFESPKPTVGRRTDGVGMFYAGKVHTIASESEGGKTWLSLSAAIDELLAGQHVIYLDFEDSEIGIVRRLLNLQCPREAILERFHYVRPSDALGAGINADDLRHLLQTHRPTLTVIDGVTEAMTLHGMDPLSNKDIATFGRLLPRQIAETGPAVVCLDHVVKSGENRGRYALGGVHKLNGLDGAAYVLENRKPFGHGLMGISTVKIAKDRPGELRSNGLPGKEGLFWFADLKLTSHAEGFLEVEVLAPAERDGSAVRPTKVMAAICVALADKGSMSQRQIEAVVTGKSKTIRDAIALLQVEGYVTNGTPVTLIKPFEGGDC